MPLDGAWLSSIAALTRIPMARDFIEWVIELLRDRIGYIILLISHVKATLTPAAVVIG